jgi:hypothetical protein
MFFIRWRAIISVAVCWLGCLHSVDAADPDIDAILKDANRRAAWERLVERGPVALPLLLDGMDSKDTAAVNWLRTAFDRIVDKELAAGGKRLDVDALRKYAEDPKRPGRARRLTLDLVEQLRPGTRDQLVSHWLDDPEFRFDAIAELIKKADKLPAADAKKELLRAFAAARDIEQTKQLAVKLDKVGEKVSVARHLGFILDWHAVGPFDAMGQQGFKTAYPPEKNVDLTAQFKGRDGVLKWKRFTLKEPSPSSGGRFGLINLIEPLGTHHDAVAYAYATIRVEKPVEAEFRGAADDNFTVWVNGRRVFSFEEYRNGVRHDRHRFKALLKEGDNSLLVKICQAPFDTSNPEPNWEFLLRVVGPDGAGLHFVQP